MADRGTFRVVTPPLHRVNALSWAKLWTKLQPGPQNVATGFGQPINRLLAGDPNQAFAMYAGQFTFAGETFKGTGPEIFGGRTGSLAWRTGLQNLGWLQHFAASNRNLHAHFALRLLGHWHQVNKAPRDCATAAKIILALSIDGANLAKSCDAHLQQEFLQFVTKQTKVLLRSTPRNLQLSLLKSVALLHAVTAFQGLDALRKPAIELFGNTIDKIILADGGHISRNPQDVLILLALLMPLKVAMKSAHFNFPASGAKAVERMLPFVAMHTFRDGGLAKFCNNNPQPDMITAILRLDDTKAQALIHARYSRYARLDQSKVALLVDTQRAYDFEFADGPQRLFTSTALHHNENGSAQFHESQKGTVLQIDLALDCSRTYFLSANGNDLRVEDIHGNPLEITLHLEPDIKLSALREGTGIMLVTPDRTVWQLSWRGGDAHIEQNGAMIKIESNGGQRLNWALKKQPKSAKVTQRKRDNEPDLLT